MRHKDLQAADAVLRSPHPGGGEEEGQLGGTDGADLHRTAEHLRHGHREPFGQTGQDDSPREAVPSRVVGLKGAPDTPDVPLHHPRLLPPAGAVEAVARAQAVAFAAAASPGSGA